MKKKRYKMRRKTKAIVGLILCLALLCANIALRGYTLTRNTLLESLEDYYSTGELEIVSEPPRLSIKEPNNYRFYLMENDTCFALMSICYNLFYGWLDGPCLIVEKDESTPLNIAYNDYSSGNDQSKEQIRIFGFVSEEDISRVEVEINFSQLGAGQTLEKTTLECEEFTQHGSVRYFLIDYTYVVNLSEFIALPIVANAYNTEGELVYTQEIAIGQGTSIG